MLVLFVRNNQQTENQGLILLNNKYLHSIHNVMKMRH